MLQRRQRRQRASVLFVAGGRRHPEGTQLPQGETRRDPSRRQAVQYSTRRQRPSPDEIKRIFASPTQRTNKLEQGTLTEGEGSVRLTSLY